MRMILQTVTSICCGSVVQHKIEVMNFGLKLNDAFYTIYMTFCSR